MALIISKVQRGRGRGAMLGFPTLNINPENIPESVQGGVYSCRCKIADKYFNGIMHFGRKKTFNESESCEIHFFNFSENITVGEKIECEIFNRIRRVKKFKNAAGLKKQIKQDIKIASLHL